MYLLIKMAKLLLALSNYTYVLWKLIVMSVYSQLRLEPAFWTHTPMHAYSCTAKHAFPYVLSFHFVTFVLLTYEVVSFPTHRSNKSYEVTGTECRWLTTTLACYALHTVQGALLTVHIRRMHQSVFVNSPSPPSAISLLWFSQKYFGPTTSLTTSLATIPGAHPVSLLRHE